MVSMRSYAGIALCLFFVLHVLRDSSVHADQGRGRKGNWLTENTEGNVASSQKELVDGATTTTTTTMGDGKRGLGGRKMVVDKVVKKEEGLKGESSKISGASATYFARKCYDTEGKQDLNAKCALISGKRRISKKFRVAGFVAFGADYHVPKHHPPKNN